MTVKHAFYCNSPYIPAMPVRVVPSALVPVLHSFSLGNRHTHQEPLVFTVTGQPSTGRLSLAELSHCLRQRSGIFTNRLRHCAICAGHLLLALLLIYVLLSRLKSKASHPRLHTLSYVPEQVNKWRDERSPGQLYRQVL